ncbi:MAG: hypothetical protein CL840_03050 [Crocinitomicaceae bacterium]|nr:hypothetical protein [Crocinitomicaceae bacterium]|tara:strand:- start:371413 stop:372096 length:684 start_codon:yes stop_codon:yes gene_type:complete
MSNDRNALLIQLTALLGQAFEKSALPLINEACRAISLEISDDFTELFAGNDIEICGRIKDEHWFDVTLHVGRGWHASTQSKGELKNLTEYYDSKYTAFLQGIISLITAKSIAVENLITELERRATVDGDLPDVMSVDYQAAQKLRQLLAGFADGYELAQFTSYSEIVGHVTGRNQPTIREHCDKVYAHAATLDTDRLVFDEPILTKEQGERWVHAAENARSKLNTEQ